MRTNIDIDDELMEEAMKATGQRTKKATVVQALREAVQTARQTAGLWRSSVVSAGKAISTRCAMNWTASMSIGACRTSDDRRR